MNIKLKIPDSFFFGEERCGYYVSPEMKRVWAVMLDLIAEFQRVCEKHNLKWWMDGGTLLGAARHKGFIPWDDDVDVIMMRDDYSRFCEIAPDEFSSPYRITTHETEEFGRLMPMSKLSNEETTILENHTLSYMEQGIRPSYSQGIYIDIFPLDDLPDNEAEAKRFIHRLRKTCLKSFKLMRWTDLYTPAKKSWKKPIKAALHYVCSRLNLSHANYRKFLDDIEANRHPHSQRVAKTVFINDQKFEARRIWNRSWFDDTVYLPFEMFSLPAPAGYTDVLDKFYGNWRKYFIRVAHGGFYDTERPYTYYMQEGHIPE